MKSSSFFNDLYDRLMFWISFAGFLLSIVLVAICHINPYKIPIFMNIPSCYLFADLYLSVMLSVFVGNRYLRKFLMMLGLYIGILFLVYLVRAYFRFPDMNIYGYRISAEIFGIKTLFIDAVFFFLLAAISVFKLIRHPDTKKY